MCILPYNLQFHVSHREVFSPAGPTVAFNVECSFGDRRDERCLVLARRLAAVVFEATGKPLALAIGLPLLDVDEEGEDMVGMLLAKALAPTSSTGVQETPSGISGGAVKASDDGSSSGDGATKGSVSAKAGSIEQSVAIVKGIVAAVTRNISAVV